MVNYKEGSGAGRLVQYGNTLRMSLHHPVFGVGPGNWSVVYPHFAAEHDPSLSREGMTSNPWPSSDWRTFLSERGLAAFVMLMLAMMALVADALRGTRADVDVEDGGSGLGSVDARLRDLGWRDRHRRILGGRIGRSGDRTGDDDLALHC